MNKNIINLILAKPRGFCAGVERAINIVEIALAKYGAPIYVHHEIVHNKYVIDNLRSKGVIFVSTISQIPYNKVCIFSAHGVSDAVQQQAQDKNLLVIDATCPLVTKVHREARKNEQAGKQVILIGHKGHPEVIGTSGKIKQEVLLVSTIKDINNLIVDDPDNLAYVTQTTLSVDDTKNIVAKLKERFPNIEGPDLKNICYATQNRQNAVKNLTKHVELVLVIGAQNSSNSNRLKDIARQMGKQSYLINNAQDIDLKWFDNIKHVGITAGASAPEKLVTDVVVNIKQHFDVILKELNGNDENIRFNIPKILRGEQ